MIKLERIQHILSDFRTMIQEDDLFAACPPDAKYPDHILLHLFASGNNSLVIAGSSGRYIDSIDDEYSALSFINEWNKHSNGSTAYLVQGKEGKYTAAIHYEILMANKMDDDSLETAIYHCIAQFSMYYHSLYENRIYNSPNELL